MIAALLLAATPFVDAFWHRDLGALTRELHEDPSAGEEHALFADLLSLATCAPLPPLSQPSPWRALIRAEEARRGTPGTLWDDVLKKGFFSLHVWNPGGATPLRWPDEAERWPVEVALLADPAWRCGDAPRRAQPVEALPLSLIAELPPEAGARVAYQRAVLLWRKGSLDGVEAIDLASLDPALRFAARFLRLEKGLDPPEQWVALAAAWPADRDGLAVLVRAADQLYRDRQHRAVVDLTAAIQPPSKPDRVALVRHALLLRALSQHVLGDDDGMLRSLSVALPLSATLRGVEAFRGLALDALARRGLDPAALQTVGLPLQSALEQLGHRAVSAGNLVTARAVAAKLSEDHDPRWRAAALALGGEIAWESGEPAGVRNAFSRLFTNLRHESLRAPDRDAAALTLAHALVLAAVERPDPRLAGALAEELNSLRMRIGMHDVPEIEELSLALREALPERGEQPVALGEVEVGVAPEAPPAPAAVIDLPDAFSLLAIPAPDGSWKAWFPRGPP